MVDEDNRPSTPPGEEVLPEAEDQLPSVSAAEADDVEVTDLGVTRYVFSAFFIGGIIIAYLAGKILESMWNALAGWAGAVRAAPFLVQYAEDERATYAMALGALVGVVVVVLLYRRDRVRTFADEVATELYKVTWPTKEVVTNGTVVVLIGVAIATVFIGIVDRVWAFLTGLVYGA